VNFGVGNVVRAVFHLGAMMVEGCANDGATAAGVANGGIIVKIKFAALLRGLVFVNVRYDCRPPAYEKHIGAKVENLFGYVMVEAANYAHNGNHRHDTYDD